MIYKAVNNKLSIPVEMVQYAFQNKLLKALIIYIVLKFYSSGRIYQEEALQILSNTLHLQKRTLLKHLEICQKLNWIGFNEDSGYYYPRGFETVRKQYSFKKRHACNCKVENLKKIDSFFAGAVLSKEVNAKKYFHVIKGGKYPVATNKGGVAFQANITSKYRKYPYEHYGLSNSIIAVILGCKYTRACQLKLEAAKNGFIEVNQKFKTVAAIPNDLNAINYLKDMNSKIGNRLKYYTEAGTTFLKEQLFDEIIPRVQITKRKKLSLRQLEAA